MKMMFPSHCCFKGGVSWNYVILLMSAVSVYYYYLSHTSLSYIFCFILKDFLHRTWLQGHSRLPWRRIWPVCKKAGSKLQSAQVDDRCKGDKHVIIWMHMLCLSLSLSLCLLHPYIRCNWMCPLDLYVVRVTSWHQRAEWVLELGWCHARIEGVIDKCDMLIWGQMEEKIPLSAHEGTSHGSCFRGGCHLNSRTSTVDLACKRKEMIVIRCFCFWTLFVSPWSCLNRDTLLQATLEMWSSQFSWFTLCHIQCSDPLEKSVSGQWMNKLINTWLKCL